MDRYRFADLVALECQVRLLTSERDVLKRYATRLERDIARAWKDLSAASAALDEAQELQRIRIEEESSMQEGAHVLARRLREETLRGDFLAKELKAAQELSGGRPVEEEIYGVQQEKTDEQPQAASEAPSAAASPAGVAVAPDSSAASGGDSLAAPQPTSETSEAGAAAAPDSSMAAEGDSVAAPIGNPEEPAEPEPQGRTSPIASMAIGDMSSDGTNGEAGPRSALKGRRPSQMRHRPTAVIACKDKLAKLAASARTGNSATSEDTSALPPGRRIRRKTEVGSSVACFLSSGQGSDAAPKPSLAKRRASVDAAVFLVGSLGWGGKNSGGGRRMKKKASQPTVHEEDEEEPSGMCRAVTEPASKRPCCLCGRGREESEDEGVREAVTSTSAGEWLNKQVREAQDAVATQASERAKTLAAELDAFSKKLCKATQDVKRAIERSATVEDEPTMWCVTLDQLREFHKEIKVDLEEYCRCHDLLHTGLHGSGSRHVCLGHICDCDHKHHDVVARKEISKRDAQNVEFLEPNMQIVLERYILAPPKSDAGSSSGSCDSSSDITNGKGSGQCFALRKNPGGRLVEYFVTHTWMEHFAGFMDSLEVALTGPENLWISAFALPQDKVFDAVASAKAERGGVAASAFSNALAEAARCLVCLDSRGLLGQRAWCMCEIAMAIHHGVEVVPTFHTAAHLNETKDKVQQIDVRKSRCTTQGDKIRLAKYFHSFGSFDQLNTRIRETLLRHVKPCLFMARRTKALHDLQHAIIAAQKSGDDALLAEKKAVRVALLKGILEAARSDDPSGALTHGALASEAASSSDALEGSASADASRGLSSEAAAPASVAAGASGPPSAGSIPAASVGTAAAASTAAAAAASAAKAADSALASVASGPASFVPSPAAPTRA